VARWKTEEYPRIRADAAKGRATIYVDDEAEIQAERLKRAAD
jgi:hypothetical protein